MTSLTLLLIGLPLTAPADELLVSSFQPAAVQRFELPTGLYLGEVIIPGGVDLPTFLRTRPRIGRVCEGAPNSVGDGAFLTASGWTHISGGSLILHASYGPPPAAQRAAAHICVTHSRGRKPISTNPGGNPWAGSRRRTRSRPSPCARTSGGKGLLASCSRMRRKVGLSLRK